MLNNLYGMITCKEFEYYMPFYLDNELSDMKQTLFDRHLRVCRDCHDYLAAYQRTVEMSQAVYHLADESISVEVPENLIKAILKARKR